MSRIPDVESVSGALADLMDMEQERVEQEEQARLAKEEEERRAREQEERRAREEQELEARQAEEERLAKIKAEQDEIERKKHEKKLAELELKKKIETDARLREEEMRLRHEQQLATIEASGKKGFPGWGWAVLGAVVLAIAGGTAGIVLYLQDQAAKEQKLLQDQNDALIAQQEADRAEQDRKLADLYAAIKAYQDKEKITEAERAELADLEKQAAAAEEAIEATGGKPRKPRPGGKPKPSTASKPSTDMTDPIAGLFGDDSPKKKKKKKK